MNITILNKAYPLKEYEKTNSPETEKRKLLTEAIRYLEIKTRGFEFPELLTKEEFDLVEKWLIPEAKKLKLITEQKKEKGKKINKIKLLRLKSKSAKAKLKL